MSHWWAVWGLGLALSACGGKSMNATDLSNQAGSGGASGEPFDAGGASPDMSGHSALGGAGSGVRISSGAWLITSGFKFSDATVDPVACEGFWPTLDLIDQGDSVHAFLGVDGSMEEATFVRAPNSDSISLATPLRFVPPASKCAVSYYEFKTFDVSPAHGLLDSPEEFSLLSVRGGGTARFTIGRLADDADMTLGGEGYPDTIAPTILSEAIHNPLDPISLAVSEPLQTAKLVLVDGAPNSAPSATFMPPAEGGALIRLNADDILPFAQKYHLEGSGLDFAGNQLVLGNVLSTLEDPGVFAQGSFEGLPSAALAGNAQFIDQTYGVMIPNGTHALLIEPDGNATFHLTRSTRGPGAVSVEFRELVGDPAELTYSGNLTLEAGVIGGSKRARSEFIAVGPTTTIHVGQWKAVSAASKLVVALPETGSDVVVRFSSSPSSCGDVPCPPAALLIDDLSLE